MDCNIETSITTKVFYKGKKQTFHSHNKPCTLLDNPNVLLSMRHGLGDAAQFCIVLKHLHKYRPNWNITIECGYGKDTCFTGMCDKIHISSSPNFSYDWVNNGKIASEDDYDQTFDFYWFEASEGASDKCLTHKVPATKVTKALTEVFHIEPDPELFEYPKIPIPSHNDSAAEKYIKKLPPHKCVGIHYQGNTSAWNKNIDDDIMRHICNFITHHNYNVIILDWDGRSVLPNTRTIFCPGKNDPIWDGKGVGNAATIAALMNRFELFIGIDSGPLHIAGCTNTPTIGIWTHHHPIHFFDFADNVLHMLPKDAIKNIHARDIKSVNKFFQDNYQHKYYGNLKKDLMDEICKHLGLKETDKINQAVTSVVKNDVVKDNKGSKNQAVTSVVKDNKGSKDSNKNKINQVAYSARKLKIVEKRNRKTESLHNEGKQTVTKIGKWWALGPKKPIVN